MRSSLMIGYFLRTSAAASRPIVTSCSGVYLFFGSLIAVCAKMLVTDAQSTIARAVARVPRLLIAMTLVPFSVP